jgi:arylsulfatase A-like enzyme
MAGDGGATQPPNVLVIMVDQQCYDCIGYAGMRPVATPNIDRLASEGAWFEHAFTPTPLCCPARLSFLTGRRPESHGSLWNYDQELPAQALPADQPTWLRALQQLGYRSGYLGKWHVHPDNDPTAYGYVDYVDDASYAEILADRHPEAHYEQELLGERDPVPERDARPAWLAGRAAELLREYASGGRPWHLRVDFWEPQLPSRPAGRFADMYEADTIAPWDSFAEDFSDKPYIQRQQLLNWRLEDWTWDDWAPVVARYRRIVSQVYAAIGSLLEALEEAGAADDTLVVYTTDHGDMCGAHRMMDKHYVMYDDVVRVPLAVRWPERIAAGQHRDELACHLLDLAPTILEAAGVAWSQPLHGRSLLPLLTGEHVQEWPDHVVSTYNGQQFGLYTQRMIRDLRWKYVWNTVDVDELYDLEADPHELHNRVHDDSCAATLAELRRRLHDELVACGDMLAGRWLAPQLLEGRKW